MRARILNPDGTFSYADVKKSAPKASTESKPLTKREEKDDKEKPVTERPVMKLNLKELKELAVTEGVDFAKNVTKKRLLEQIIQRRQGQKSEAVAKLNSEVKGEETSVIKAQKQDEKMAEIGL